MDHHDSGIGKALSCAIKQALLKMFCLDNYGTGEEPRTVQSPQNGEIISKEQLEEVLRLAKYKPKKFEKILQLFDIEDVTQIPVNYYARVLAAFKSNRSVQMREQPRGN